MSRSVINKKVMLRIRMVIWVDNIFEKLLFLCFFRYAHIFIVKTNAMPIPVVGLNTDITLFTTIMQYTNSNLKIDTHLFRL